MPERTQQYRPDDRLGDAQTPVTVAQAAQLLGLSAEAVRSRVQRGTLASTKVDGKVYVLLEPDQVRLNEHLSGEQKADEDRPSENLSGDQTELVASLQEQVDWLRREVERKDTLLMSLMQRIPELEAPTEPRETTENGSEGASSGTATPKQQEPSEGRSWLHRFFFGP